MSPNEDREVISIKGLSLAFPRGGKGDVLQVVDDVSLELGSRDILAVLGPSGCGKSTILNVVAGLVQAAPGVVRCFGEPVRGINRQVGYVTQRDTLLPWRTVESNLALPLQIARMNDREARINRELKRVGLLDFRGYYPPQLSGGMRSRVNLARVLIYEPPILLMDEPFAALDALTRENMQQELLDICAEQPKTMIYVTHDIDEAITLGDRIIVMSRRPARIKAMFDSPFPFPRSVEAIREDPRSSALRREIWSALKDELE